jgi:hypothetical protein
MPASERRLLFAFSYGFIIREAGGAVSCCTSAKSSSHGPIVSYRHFRLLLQVALTEFPRKGGAQKYVRSGSWERIAKMVGA